MDAPYGIYISGKGMSESVPVIGTRSSCPVGSRGTIKVITRYPHTPGYTVGSASGGNQEAINSATAAIGGSFAIIQEVPAGGGGQLQHLLASIFEHQQDHSARRWRTVELLHALCMPFDHELFRCQSGPQCYSWIVICSSDKR